MTSVPFPALYQIQSDHGSDQAAIQKYGLGRRVDYFAKKAPETCPALRARLVGVIYETSPPETHFLEETDTG